jgi:hypothetical protein
MNICATTITTTSNGSSDRSSYPTVHAAAMAESFLRAALIKAREETEDPVEMCRLCYTLHSFLSSWTKTFQLESSLLSSGTNRKKHYFNRRPQREAASVNDDNRDDDDQTTKQSTSSSLLSLLLASYTPPRQVPIRRHRQVFSQDLLVSTRTTSRRRQGGFRLHDDNNDDRTTTTITLQQHPHAAANNVVWHPSLALLISQELEATTIFATTKNRGLRNQVRQLLEVCKTDI